MFHTFFHSKDVQRLKQLAPCGSGQTISAESLINQTCWEIDSHKILSVVPDISKLIFSHFGLPSTDKFNIHPNLDKVILCESGCHYKNVKNLSKLGMFLRSYSHLSKTYLTNNRKSIFC